ncbi:MAG TPA: electron transporter RnfD, partial [Fervidobacterium sp.]|nr:electron transporter RnfD [Fervidobacterium sp.]
MKLLTTSAPHVRTQDSTRKIMIDVLIALIPAVIAATYFFGFYALILAIVGVVSA